MRGFALAGLLDEGESGEEDPEEYSLSGLPMRGDGAGLGSLLP